MRVPCFTLPVREIDLRKNLVGTGFNDAPKEYEEYSHRLNCIGKRSRFFRNSNHLFELVIAGEIVSAIGFDASSERKRPRLEGGILN